MDEATTNTTSEPIRVTDATGYLASADEDIMLPDGWTEGDDVFDPDSWGTGTTTGGSETETQAEESSDADEAQSEAPTTEQSEEQTDRDSSDAEADAADAPKKIRINVKVDHKDQEVELDEADLPALYQKAQVVDRLQKKADAAQTRNDNAERLAKIMGYADADEMLKAAEDNFRESEIARLMDGGITDKSVAEDMLNTKWAKYGEAKAVEKQTADAVSQTDGTTSTKTVPGAKPQDVYLSEVTELFKGHPELAGKPLPDEVVRTAVFGGKTVSQAYEEYTGKVAKAENKKLSKENKVLRQNAASAAKAPVRGTSSGAATAVQSEDDFVKGFDSYGW